MRIRQRRDTEFDAFQIQHGVTWPTWFTDAILNGTIVVTHTPMHGFTIRNKEGDAGGLLAWVVHENRNFRFFSTGEMRLRFVNADGTEIQGTAPTLPEGEARV